MSENLPTAALQVAPRTEIGVGWFLKRTVAAVIILCVSIGGVAWLMHASIDPALDANAAETRLSNEDAHITGSL